MAKPSQFRLSQHTLDDLEALAAGLGGVRSPALRDAIHYWRKIVEDAGRQNAAELAKEDWIRLAHLNDPNPLPPSIEDDSATIAPDWSQRLAAELCGMWEGKPLLPTHAAENKACEKLAKRIASFGLVRGYALYLCLSHFWGPAVATAGDGEWWHPSTWLTPTAREGRSCDVASDN